MKKLMKNVGFYSIFLIIIVFLCSLLNLIGTNYTITNLLLLIFNILAFFVFSFSTGKTATAKGYIAGLKQGLLFLGVLIIISLISSRNIFTLSTIIYYVVLLLTSLIGGMMGINKKDITSKN